MVKLLKDLTDAKSEYEQLDKQFVQKNIHDCKPNHFKRIPGIPQEDTGRVIQRLLIYDLKFDKSTPDNMYLHVMHRKPVSEYKRKHRSYVHKSTM